MPFLAACIQMTSGDDIAENIAQLTPLLQQAVARGARLIVTPENTFYMRREGSMAKESMPMHAHPGVLFAQQFAQEHKVWLIIGSIRAKEDGSEKSANRQVMIAPDGAIVRVYDKLHLFDVELAGGHSYRESAQFFAGDEAVLLRTQDVGAIGASICYDLRFPHLYRALAQQGAEIFLVPSAFTRVTGEAHWHVLLRARAIENAAYVLAPGQCGTHPGGRETYGHSLIVDPWGKVIAEADGATPGVITAEISLAEVARVRAQLPALKHQRTDFSLRADA